MSGFDLIEQAQRLADAVRRFREHVRAYFYQAVLCGRICPKYGSRLNLLRDGACQCVARSHRFDRTVTFQVCSA